jgi:BMFP domain-containing protein YqiC
MPQRTRLLNDASRLAEGALGTLAGVRREAETLVRQQMERMLDRMELVTRDEFEAVREMAANARAEQELLAKRVEALEAELARAKAARPAAGRKAKAAPSGKTG